LPLNAKISKFNDGVNVSVKKFEINDARASANKNLMTPIEGLMHITAKNLVKNEKNRPKANHNTKKATTKSKSDISAFIFH